MEFIRFAMRLATSGQLSSRFALMNRKCEFTSMIQQFFKQSFSSNWWKQMLSQFPADIQNYINQIKSIELEPALAAPEPKRIKLDSNENSEVQKVIQLLNSFKLNEMSLYIKSLKGSEQCIAWSLSSVDPVFIEAIPYFLDEVSDLSESTSFIKSIL